MSVIFHFSFLKRVFRFLTLKVCVGKLAGFISISWLPTLCVRILVSVFSFSSTVSLMISHVLSDTSRAVSTMFSSLAMFGLCGRAFPRYFWTSLMWCCMVFSLVVLMVLWSIAMVSLVSLFTIMRSGLGLGRRCFLSMYFSLASMKARSFGLFCRRSFMAISVVTLCLYSVYSSVYRCTSSSIVGGLFSFGILVLL